jgi:hypothetical protein
MFHEFDINHNMNLRRLAIQTEEQARADGYHIILNDGDGLLTWVEFEDAADMVIFKLKYMSYVLPLPRWLVERGYAHDVS